MAVTALVLSVVAVLAAIASVLIARKALSIEASRRRDEIAPRLTVGVKVADGIGGGLITIQNDGPLDLDGLDVRILPPHAHEEKTAVALICDKAVSTRQALPALPCGEANQVVVQLEDPDRGGLVRIMCTSRSGKESWESIHEVRFPMRRWLP